MEVIEELAGSIAELDSLISSFSSRFPDGVARDRFNNVCSLVRSLRIDKGVQLEALNSLESVVSGLPQAFDYVLSGALSDEEYDKVIRLLDAVVVSLNRISVAINHLPTGDSP